MSTFTLQHSGHRFLTLALVVIGAWQAPALAITDLANAPLASASSDEVKPNIMFVLDDSGSMNLKFMPDGLSSRENRIGMRNNQCNLVYYNPAIRYVIPKTSTGGDVNSGAQTSFTAAYEEGFWAYDGEANTTTNLSSSFRAVTDDNLSYSTDENDASQAAYYWQYLGSTTLVPLAGDCEKTLTGAADGTTTGYCVDDPAIGGTVADYRVSNSPPTCTTAGSKLLWKKIVVSSTSGPGTTDINGDGGISAADTDERQNFANWYSYYRNRMKMMKSASGRAFVQMSDAYRIGFVTINPNNPVTASKFLTIANFDAGQKASWFTKLYSQSNNGSTPLRQALSRVGRYFSGKTDGINSGMTGDPVQYSCQQNFSILTTDGYWNGSVGEQLNGTTDIDNHDGVISELDAYRPVGSKYAMSPRPVFDGSSQTYAWNTASIQYQNGSCVYATQPQQRTVQFQSCTSTNHLKKRTSSNSGSTWTPWYFTTSCTVDNSGSSRTQCATGGTGLQTRTSTDYGTTWTAWDYTSSCTADNSGSNRRECRTTAYKCESAATWTNAQCTGTDAATLPLCQSSAGSWADVASCTASAQDAGGAAIECQTVDTLGYISQYLPTTYETVYVGPGGPAGGTQILDGPTPSVGSWTDVPAATCQATPPALPAGGTVTGVGPPPAPADCTSGIQEWPCETYASGGGGVSANITSITVTGTEDPYIATATTSADHSFVVGHSVNITNVTSAYGGFREIIEVPDNRHFKYYVPTHPGVSDGTGTATLSGGSTGSLADVAQYYYKTDLRTSALGNCTGALGGTTSVCDNNVPSSGNGAEDDRVNWQHMTTFTMGLGLTGTVQYSPTYRTDSKLNVVTWPATNGQITGRLDFQDIRLGTANWPIPQSDSATALDDLWHAAVNGRGQYFSAGDPDTVITSLTDALAGISARVASAAAAATSNLEPVAGDNFAYTAKYTTQKWTGELEAREIDLASGVVSGTAIWSASAKLDALTGGACDNRNIKLFRSGASNNLVDFKWNTDTCSSGVPAGSPQTNLNAAEQAYFSAAQVSLFSHYPLMGDGTGVTVNQRTPAAGANLVNYLRGQRGKEGFDSGPPITNTDVNKLYRARDAVLGDIVNAQPVFVKSPFAEYTDAGYVAFRAAQAGRTPVVYVAANDGMLHAFKAGTSVVDTEGGKEAWAFIPTMVLPNLYKMASEGYSTDHVYSVDGTPTAGDIMDKTASADCALATPTAPEACWKTILVGGLNKGGQGYYALDITDPATPKALWEFKNSASCITVDATTKAPTAAAYTDCHIGYTFNNPVIGKLADGTWAVFVTSGYNNDDGIGYLYVLNAATGQVLYRISTGVGSAVNPSGLNHINAWVDNGLFNNTITRVYGADLHGNIWRFDVNNSIGPAGREAQLVAQAVDSVGTPQPITTKPELAEIAGEPFVYVATGRYLGVTDKSDIQTQTIWAIKDPMTSISPPTDASVTNLRTILGGRTISNVGSGTAAYRTVTPTASCTTGQGWFADLPDTGERVNIDIKLQLGTLVAASNVPEVNACNVGGYGWLNYFNYLTGCAVATATNASVGQRLVGASGTESLAVGTNVVRLPGGKVVVIATTSAAEQITFDAPFDTPPPAGKRVSWREIVQ